MAKYEFSKMDKKLKTKWVKALRSRKYKQGGNYLCQRREGKDVYCCLGVLAEVAGETFDKSDLTYELLDGSCSVLSFDLLEKYGLDYNAQDFLTAANDSGTWRGRLFRKPWRFGKIANWIEKNL